MDKLTPIQEKVYDLFHSYKTETRVARFIPEVHRDVKDYLKGLERFEEWSERAGSRLMAKCATA